jgi:hypothetical protein
MPLHGTTGQATWWLGHAQKDARHLLASSTSTLTASLTEMMMHTVMLVTAAMSSVAAVTQTLITSRSAMLTTLTEMLAVLTSDTKAVRIVVAAAVVTLQSTMSQPTARPVTMLVQPDTREKPFDCTDH